jgi:hypothetical protein
MHAPRRSLLPRFGVPTPSSVRRWVRGYSSGNKRLAFQVMPRTPSMRVRHKRAMPWVARRRRLTGLRTSQLLVSYAVLFAVFSPEPVWNALSYADVSPAIIIILLTVYQPQNGERVADAPTCPAPASPAATSPLRVTSPPPPPPPALLPQRACGHCSPATSWSAVCWAAGYRSRSCSPPGRPTAGRTRAPSPRAPPLFA